MKYESPYQKIAQVPEDLLKKDFVIQVCQDRTITWRHRDDPIFNEVAVAAYTVDTKNEADAIVTLLGSRQYEEHPKIPGQPWLKISIDYKNELEFRDVYDVTEKIKMAHKMLARVE